MCCVALSIAENCPAVVILSLSFGRVGGLICSAGFLLQQAASQESEAAAAALHKKVADQDAETERAAKVAALAEKQRAARVAMGDTALGEGEHDIVQAAVSIAHNL